MSDMLGQTDRRRQSAGAFHLSATSAGGPLLLVHKSVTPNCSVRMSPHGDMGDIDDEPKGSPAGRAAEGGAGRE